MHSVETSFTNYVSYTHQKLFTWVNPVLISTTVSVQLIFIQVR